MSDLHSDYRLPFCNMLEQTLSPCLLFSFMQWKCHFFSASPGNMKGAVAVNEYGGPLKGYGHQLCLREGWYMGGWSLKFGFKGEDCTADVEDLGHARLR